jgi:hypothetical protein
MTGYEAAVALALATIPVYAEGYRTERIGHHQTTFLAVSMVMGDEASDLADYFDTCRTKRNATAYDRVGSTSEMEVEELVDAVGTFREMVQEWLKANHPGLVGS